MPNSPPTPLQSLGDRGRVARGLFHRGRAAHGLDAAAAHSEQPPRGGDSSRIAVSDRLFDGRSRSGRPPARIARRRPGVPRLASRRGHRASRDGRGIGHRRDPCVVRRRRRQVTMGAEAPRLVRHWQRLAGLFPDARFIHLVRDPRAVAASLRSSAAHRSHALAAARRWRLDTGFGLAMEGMLGSRALRVHYEDLVRKPEPTVRQVCAFLDLAFDAKMLRPAVRFDSTRMKSSEAITSG